MGYSRSKLALAGCLLLVGSLCHAGITLKEGPPPGFENLSTPQRTAADVYFGGRFLTTAFVEFDLQTVTIEDVESIIAKIPNVKNTRLVVQTLADKLPSHSESLCTTRRRENCGRITPEVAAVIFDESRFRLDLFLHPDQLLLHKIQRDRYLPAPSARSSLLHNIRINAAGSSEQKRFTIGTESFLAYDQSRLRARYTATEEGFALREFTWQRDDKDMEYEIGSFESVGRNLSTINHVDVIGMRVASSTKTRVDLDDALASPVMIFLPERSRVDVFRGDELLDSRYYEAGNQQIDTATFPDGAYPLDIRIVTPDGRESTQSHFFVRSSLMPPMGEPQYHLEVGSLVQPGDASIPRAGAGRWVRAGMSHRLRKDVGLDAEIIHANSESLIQTGVIVLKPQWHLQTSALASNLGTYGFAVNGGYRRGDVGLFFDMRHVEARNRNLAYDEFVLFRSGYTQGSATLSFPFWRGRGFVRARVSEKSEARDNGIGFSYWGSLYQHRFFDVDLTLDTHFASSERWVRAGFTLRWRSGSDSATVKPQALWRTDDFGQDVTGSLDAHLQREARLPLLGHAQQSFFVAKDEYRKMAGVRLTPRENQYSNFELRYEKDERRSDLYYQVNNSFSIATTNGRTSLGNGGQSVGAVVVNIVGNVTGKFAVLVDNRVVDHVWAGRPSVISLRPYASYELRIKPLGDGIVGFDQRTQHVTLYPGNVENLTYEAHALTVIIAQAIHPDGTPVAPSRFLNVEGYGATDDGGWFQIETRHRDALTIEDRDGNQCQMVLPEFEAEQGLAVLDPLVCAPIQAQP